MKFKTTKKRNYEKVIKVPYCALQNALVYERPIAYTAGKYGWNADIYDIAGLAIVTGYAPFGNVAISRDEIAEVENEAQHVRFSGLSFEEEKEALRAVVVSLLKREVK